MRGAAVMVALALWTGTGCAVGGGSRGVPWTIRCLELSGPNRMEQAEQFASSLKRTPGIRASEVFVIHDDDGVSRLYYGRYRRRVERGGARAPMPKRMREDLNLLHQLGDSQGRRYFLQAIPVPMPQPDVGRPEWRLDRVNAMYSLQVAAFEPMGNFWEYKKAAAEYCAFLRKKGYEAYYYHGPSGSVVTVGAFGPDAVYRGADGRTYYSAEVLKLQRDPLLRYNLLNGAVYRVRGEEGEKVRVPSRLVRIPHKGEALSSP